MRASFSPKLAWHVLNNDLARRQFDLLSNSTTGLANLNGTMIGQILFPVPPLSEQTTIAAFLDCETAKIDALVAEQQRLIELLKEKRQALISHAVTQGLDPAAPTKDSGIEWLGKVPAHWEVVRLGTLFKEFSDEGEKDRPILSVSIHHGVSDREFDDDELARKVTRSDDRSKYKSVEPGDLVYNMMRAWQGGFGSVKIAGMVSPAYVVARPRCAFSTEFIEQQLRSPQAVEEMRRFSRGVTDFRLRLYWDEFKSISVVLAPPEEQSAIAAFINYETTVFDALSTEALRGIALLQERRSALISAAVTGQIDVRGLAAKEAA
jgi:type I restriction enzyme S subunit